MCGYKKPLKYMKKIIAFLLSLGIFFGCNNENSTSTKMAPLGEKSDRMVIDDAVIDSGDYFKVIDPVWWKGNIYGTYEEYEASLITFSRPQRLVFAVAWYVAEVNNGGHHQFFTNSTGIVWRDALDAFDAVGATSNAKILKEAVARIGGNPSFDRSKREEQVENSDVEFDDLDDAFYDLEDALNEKLIAYIKANRKDFYFDGVVSIPVLE